MPNLRVAFPNPCQEKWEDMTPSGCHRLCAKCDKVIHDLVQYDFSEIEKLMREEPNSCVRASIDASGMVATMPERDGSIRRIAAVVGASAGLLISQPAFADNQRVEGAIVGITQRMGFRTKVTAKDEGGNSHRAKVKSNGRYEIKGIPPGTYTVEFSSPDCGAWTVRNVIVGYGETTVADEPENDQQCIVVGLLKIDYDEG